MTESVKKKIDRFNEYLRGQGLKNTSQRNVVAEVFFSSQGHLSAEDLYRKVSRKEPGIGLTTVYRTLKLLTDAGLAAERRFGGEPSGMYEKEEDGKHHDHLICTRCGKIIEFKDARIEEMQEEVAARYGFTVEDHRMELYGICHTCSSS